MDDRLDLDPRRAREHAEASQCEGLVDRVAYEVEAVRRVRGVGEAPIIPPLAAVAGSVSNAIGVRVTELPCSPPKILAAIQQKA